MNTTLTPDERAAIRARGLCPDCGMVMQPAGTRSWICPSQLTEPKVVSAKLRESIKQTIAARVPTAPF